MNLIEDIINQLESQNLEFKIIYSKYDKDSTNNREILKALIDKWKDEFIGSSKVPYVDQYLWHVFSYKIKHCIEGKNALQEYSKQYSADCYIFNQSQTYLIECRKSIPNIELKNFLDDIYLCHHNMKWTFVLPHEIPNMGPYFATKK